MSDYITIDLRSIINKSKATSGPDTTDGTSTPADSASTESLPPKGDWLQWGELLKQRLATNDTKKPENKQSSYEIETEFFKEFYAVNWTKEIAEKLLLLGEPLKKVLKVVGFKRSNPILVFINQDYVQNTLLHANLLNVTTFKVIYNAVAKNLVADSEFFKLNNYNIIYCKDFYRRPVAEMEKYLDVQSSFLRPSARQYEPKDILKNRLAFFHIDSIKEVDNEKRAEGINKLYKENKLTAENIPVSYGSKTALNNLTLIDNLRNKLGISATGGKSGKNKNAHMSAKAMNSLLDKITRPAECFAVILHFSTTTNVPEAKQALRHEIFRTLDGEAIARATATMAPLLNKGSLPDEEVKTLVAMALSKIA